MPGLPQRIVLPQPPTRDDVFNAAAAVTGRLRHAGYEAYFAGGFARDALIGRPIHDIDIATNAHPDVVEKIFPDSREIGKSFGVIQVAAGEHRFDVATFRRDMAYHDGRHPDGVVFTTAEQDAQRRDFTVNGMFFDPTTNEVIDYVGGLDDLNRKFIRAIGRAYERFAEDHLRMLRATRFASVLQFSIEPDTWQSIQSHAPQISTVSMERIRDEFIRTLMESPRPGAALTLLRDAGLLAVILPELQAMNGVEQPPEHHPEGDVFIHTALMLDLMKERSPELIWSILMHDVAKPATFAIGTDKRTGQPKIQFRGHADLGAEMTVDIMRRFKCPNDQIDAVVIAVKNHMRFAAIPDMKESTLRRWVGSPTFPLELELHRIDCLGSHGGLEHMHQVIDFQQKLREEPVLPPPLLRGKVLLDAGFSPGPEFGRILKQAYDAQLEGKFTDHDGAMAWLSRNDPRDVGRG